VLGTDGLGLEAPPGECLREQGTLAGVVLGALDFDQFDALGVREALQHLLLRRLAS
jgi:hypothetical protein